MLAMRSFTVAIVLFASAFTQAAEKTDSIYRKIVRGTAQVQSSGGTGTGWVVDAGKKWLITADHVVGSDAQVRVIFPAYRDGRVISERKFYENRRVSVTGRVVRVDVGRDLALIELSNLPEGVKQLSLASEAPEPGEKVHAVGCPGNSSALWVYSNGSVRQSATISLTSGEPGNGPMVIETQIPLNPGDSGGPLVNDAGEVVGVNHALRRNAQLVSLSIDVGEVRAFIASKAGSKKQQLEEQMAKARKAIAERKWQEAEEHLLAVLKLGERNVEAWYLLARTYNARRDYLKASFAAIAALEKDKKCAQAWLELGYAQKELGEWDRARIALSKAIEYDPANEAARDHLEEVIASQRFADAGATSSRKRETVGGSDR